MTRYYNVHNLLKIKIQGPEKKIKYLCKQCEFFYVNEEYQKVDLEILIGKFEPFIATCDTFQYVNRKYCVSERIIYAEDMYKTAKWRLQIEDLYGPKTTFRFDGNSWTKYILHKSFVEVIIRFKLNQKGFLMVHSSAVELDNRGIVFPASPEAGKSSTVLNYLEVGGHFLSDDFSLIGQNIVYAYPTPVTLHSHNLKRNPYIAKIIPRGDKWEIFWRTLVLKLTLGIGDMSHKVDIWNYVADGQVKNSVELQEIAFLTKYNGDRLAIRQISKAEFVNKIMVVNYFETVLFNAYLQAYYYVNPANLENDFYKKMESNINKLFYSEVYTEILIPKHYTKNVFAELRKYLEREM